MDLGFDFTEKDRILVVAPHPDDEAIGCGGLLALYPNLCDVLVLTDGRRGRSKSRLHVSDEKMAATRRSESESAMAIAGVKNITFLGIPDCRLAENRKAVFGFDFSPYTYIFIPNTFEEHPDHGNAAKFIRQLRLRGRTKAKICEYEVWSAMPQTDVILDISAVEEKKLAMLSCYKSQLECRDYLRAVPGLNRYRGMQAFIESAEAFRYSMASFGERVRLFFKGRKKPVPAIWKAE